MFGRFERALCLSEVRDPVKGREDASGSDVLQASSVRNTGLYACWCASCACKMLTQAATVCRFCVRGHHEAILTAADFARDVA
jgi:hypothetical protein